MMADGFGLPKKAQSQLKILKKKAFQVSSNLEELSRVLYKFEEIHEPWIPTEDWLQSRLALAEGFTNAVRHAHKGLSAKIAIEIEVTLLQENIEIRIWDYGPPFDLQLFINNLHQKTSNLNGGGRGIEILHKISEHLSYRPTEDNRNCLLIIKKLSCTK